MSEKSITAVYYSPTGTTSQICREICRSFETNSIREIDITDKKKRNTVPKEVESDLFILALPVYAGRIPKETLSYIQGLKGSDTPAAIVAVYGNRDYDDSLMEMNNLLSSQGFKTIGAAAFIGEHSFSTEEQPIAKDRPDDKDMKEARLFGLSLNQKLSIAPEEIRPIQVPGNFPLKERKTFPIGSPETDMSKCSGCKTCLELCPVGAIKEDFSTDGEICTFCCACVKSCPTGARKLLLPSMAASRERLYNNCQERKDPELFL